MWFYNQTEATERKYTFCLFVDESKRFWWRDQMDDGTKLKPWAEPPIKGTFAIAFEVGLGRASEVEGPSLTFNVSNIDHRNVVDVPGASPVATLIYQNKTLVTFNSGNDAFRVTFEHIGMGGDNKVRGFLVLETTVGKVRQKTTSVVLPDGRTVVKIPSGTTPEAVDQLFERAVFEKEGGRYMFTVTERRLTGRLGEVVRT
jgi:hypothetical protein